MSTKMLGKLASMMGMGEEKQVEVEQLDKDKGYYGRLFTSMSPGNSPSPSFDVDEGLEREMSQQEQAVLDHKASMRIEELMTHFLGDWMKGDFEGEVDIAGAFLEYAVEAEQVPEVAVERRKRKARKKTTKLLSNPRVKSKTGKTGPPDLYHPIELPPLTDIVDIPVLLKAIDAYDSELSKAETETGRMQSVPTFPTTHAKSAEQVYDHIMLKFLDPKYKHQYGYTKEDHTSPPLKAGSSVPSYFANVKNQSIHRRKVLSLAGLRNLVKEGAPIYKEMQNQLFVGDPTKYTSGKGMNRMKTMTGNVVDLDTCVLRPSDTLTMKAINAFNVKQGEKKWGCADEFGDSEQAADIAETAAVTLLQQFMNDYELSEGEGAKRNVSPKQFKRPVPKAASNTDRGKWPLWHYVNAGQNSFHVNVPTITDVNGALLKAPLHCVKMYLTLHAAGVGEELEEKLDRFFEDAVADSCFNMKWKAIEEFAASIAHEGTISDALQRLSVTHQVQLSAVMDEDDETYTKEKQLMWGFVSSADLHGRSVANGGNTFRKIERCDVERWVDDPAAVM